MTTVIFKHFGVTTFIESFAKKWRGLKDSFCLLKWRSSAPQKLATINGLKYSIVLPTKKLNVSKLPNFLQKVMICFLKFAKFHNLESKPVLTSAYSLRFFNQIECKWSQSILIEVSVMIVKLEVCLKGRLKCLK